METRRDRGLQILGQSDDSVTQIDDYTFKVESQSVSGVFYRVEEDSRGFECECPDYQSRGSACKHIYAVQQAVRAARDGGAASRRLKPVSCMFCRSKNVAPKDLWTPAGTRRGSRNRGDDRRRLFKCGGCDRMFVRDVGSGGRKKRGLPEDTAHFDAVYMYCMGMSVADIAAHYKGSKTGVDYLSLSRWATEFPGGTPWGAGGRRHVRGLPKLQQTIGRDNAENRRMFKTGDGGIMPLAASSAPYVWRKRHSTYVMPYMFFGDSAPRKRGRGRGSGRWWVWTGKYRDRAFTASHGLKTAARKAAADE